MKDRDILLFFRELLDRKKQNISYSAEDYIIEKQIEWHTCTSDNMREQQEEYKKSEEELIAELKERIRAWETSTAEFEELAKKVEFSEELEEWQAAEMLENVIQELGLSPLDTYKYLANVKKMIYDNLLELMPEAAADTWKKELEQEYENEWMKSEQEISEQEIDVLFSETAFLMRYAGMTYEEETQIILAETAMGKEVVWKKTTFGAAEKDIRLLTNYLVSEMVLADKQSPYSLSEQQAIVCCAVPVYTTAQSYIQNGSDSGHMMKLAQSYIAKAFSSRNVKTVVGLAAVWIAVQTVWSFAVLAVTGTVIGVGISSVWALCKTIREKSKIGDMVRAVQQRLEQNRKNRDYKKKQKESQPIRSQNQDEEESSEELREEEMYDD